MATANIQAVITAEDKASKTLKGFSNNVDAGLKKIGVAMTVAGAGLTLLAKNATDFTSQLVKDTKTLSRETGATAKEASSLLFVTQRLGLSADEASQQFGFFSRRIAEAASSANPATTALGNLGVSVKNADGSTRDFNAVLLDTADKFRAMPDGPEKTAIALELFGRSGKDMIKVLNLGSQGIKDLEKKADELGLTLNAKTIGTVSKYIESQKDLKDATNALKIQIASLTTPVLTNFNEKLLGVVKAVSQGNGPLQKATANIGAFGGPLLTAAGGATTFAANAKTMGASLSAVAIAGAKVAVVIGTVVAAWTIGTRIGKFLNETIHGHSGVVKQAEIADESLNGTLRQQATTLQDVNSAVKNLDASHRDLTGASLDVERAQRNYTEAVKEYGPKSLEAREAAHNLEDAQARLVETQEQLAEKQDIVNQKQAEFASQAPGAAAAVLTLKTPFEQLSAQIQDSSNKVGGLQNTINLLTAPISAFKGELKAVNSLATQLDGVKISVGSNVSGVVQGGGSRISGVVSGGGGSTVTVQRRAIGGPVQESRPYIVGEHGPELFMPGSNGNITPNNKLGGTNVSLNVNVGVYTGSEMEKRRLAEELFKSLADIARSRSTTVVNLLGAS